MGRGDRCWEGEKNWVYLHRWPCTQKILKSTKKKTPPPPNKALLPGKPKWIQQACKIQDQCTNIHCIPIYKQQTTEK